MKAFRMPWIAFYVIEMKWNRRKTRFFLPPFGFGDWCLVICWKGFWWKCRDVLFNYNCAQWFFQLHFYDDFCPCKMSGRQTKKATKEIKQHTHMKKVNMTWQANDIRLHDKWINKWCDSMITFLALHTPENARVHFLNQFPEHTLSTHPLIRSSPFSYRIYLRLDVPSEYISTLNHRLFFLLFYLRMYLCHSYTFLGDFFPIRAYMDGGFLWCQKSCQTKMPQKLNASVKKLANEREKI